MTRVTWSRCGELDSFFDHLPNILYTGSNLGLIQDDQINHSRAQNFIGSFSSVLLLTLDWSHSGRAGKRETLCSCCHHVPQAG